MARPSRKSERREQILLATLKCVANYGVDGASLERIALEAGLQRSMIRHFVGNREKLIEGLTGFLIQRMSEAMDELYAHVKQQYKTPQQQLTALTNALFDPLFATDTHSILATEALIAAAPRFKTIQTPLENWYKNLIKGVQELLQAAHPSSDKQACREVALGLIGTWFNTDAMSPLATAQSYRDNGRKAVFRLISTLSTDADDGSKNP